MEDIGRAVERLHEDESLTADVDDAAAGALLHWGEEQIRAGRPEEDVRRGIRALNKVIARRAELDPAASRTRLEDAGLAVDESILAGLWAEHLPEGEWAQRLLLALAPTSRPPAAASPLPLSRFSGEGEGGREERVGTMPWWRRLFFWRKPQ